MKMKTFWGFKLLALLLVLFTFNILEVDAARRVRVKGYYRKDGTYVRPHYRTAPDSNPYNNYSYPGNYNPNTGKITTGNPSTYLQRYYNRSNSTYKSTPTYNQSYRLSPSQNVKDLRFKWYEYKGVETDHLNVPSTSGYTLEQQRTATVLAYKELEKARQQLYQQRIAQQSEIRKLQRQLALFKADQQAKYKKLYNNSVIEEDFRKALVYSYLIDDFSENRRKRLITFINSKSRIRYSK